MATSGAMGTTNAYIKYSIECIQNSQNISANNSSVTVKVRVWRTNSGYTTYGTGTVYCKINGSTYSAGITSGQSITSSGVEIFNKTLTIGHNADGTKTLSMSAWITHDRFSSSEQAYNQVLSTIPRASSLTLSSTTINAGASVTLNITRASSNFVHDAYFTFGSKTYSMGKSLGTSATYTIPMDCLDQIPNATAGVGTVRLYTLSGGSIVGSVDVGITINVPSSVVPTFSSLSIARIDNGVPSSWGLYVRGKSKATLTINGAAGTYGSTISKYVIEGGGYSGTSNTLTTGTLNNSGTNTFTATITDSRGRTATKSVTCSVVDYESPKINSFTVVRCTSAGVENNEGTYVKVTANLTYSSVNSKNTLNAVVAYKTASGTNWSSNTTVTSDTSVIIGKGEISTNTSYHFRLTINDTFSSSTITVTVPTAATTMDFKKGGKGVAIGKVAENDGFEVAWDTKFNKQVDMNGVTNLKSTVNISSKTNLKLGGINLIDMFYPVGSIYMSAVSTNPSNFMGGTWVAWGSGRVPVGINASDSDFNTAEKTGGAKTQELRAMIGAVNNSASALGYNPVGAVAGIGYTGGYGVVGSSPGSISTINHSTLVRRSDGNNATTVQPYITCYMWKRTA